MTSVERTMNYTTLASEAPQHQKVDDTLGEWPSKGKIVFENVKFRYRDDLENTLKGINLVIEGGEKVGCVGRTGAGKSSTIQALFRMVEIWKKGESADPNVFNNFGKEAICPLGHKCNLTKEAIKDVEEENGEFVCKKCYKKGKFEDGAYVCLH